MRICGKKNYFCTFQSTKISLIIIIFITIFIEKETVPFLHPGQMMRIYNNDDGVQFVK